MKNGNLISLPVEPQKHEATEPIPGGNFDRYKAAYEATQKGIATAQNIKYGGVFMAGLILVVTLLIQGSMKTERFGFPIITVSLTVIGVVLLLAAQFWSMMFRTQNRLLQIAIEIAANTSPLLTNTERAEILRPLDGFHLSKKNKKKAA